MSDCPKCWETPCICGHEYKDWTDKKKLDLIGSIARPPVEKKKWSKTPEDIVAEIDNDTGVDWNEESNLINLAQFIQENCDQAKFQEFIRRVANEQVSMSEP